MAEETGALPSAVAGGAPSAPARPAGIPSPCLMVYPVPSVADESFLYALFRHKVARTLFGGFGKGRFAILELTDKTMLNKIVKLLAQRDAQARLLASTAVSANAEQQSDGLAAAALAEVAEGAEGNEGKVDNWLETVKADELTFADLFMSPEAAGGSHGENSGDAVTGLLSDHKSVDYLLNLSWRGLYPMFVVESPVTVEDMYSCGGVVPEKKSTTTAAAAGGGKPKKKDGDTGTGVVKESNRNEPVDATSPPSAAPAAAAPAHVFPKDCCQKCGSPSHFTRNCSGSAIAAPPAAVSTVAASSTAAAKRPREDNDPHRSKLHSSANASPVANPPDVPQQQQHFPKDCCQRCGSKDHFTRHCDGSGVGGASSSAPVHVEPTVKSAKVEERKEAKAAVIAPAEKQQPTAVAPAAAATARPTFVRASKDQCKFCGSDSHLSRHCPKK